MTSNLRCVWNRVVLVYRYLKAHSLIFEVELSNQPAVVSGVHGLSSNHSSTLVCVLLALMRRSAAADRADGVVGVGPDVQIVHLTALIGKPHHQSDVLPPERPERIKIKGTVHQTILSLFTHPRVAPNLYEVFVLTQRKMF